MRKPGGSHGGSDEDLVNMVTNGGGGAAPAPAPAPIPAGRGIHDNARSIIQQKIGRQPTDAEVARFLSSPRNRQLLGGQ
jgi:hypothetical protein